MRKGSLYEDWGHVRTGIYMRTGVHEDWGYMRNGVILGRGLYEGWGYMKSGVLQGLKLYEDWGYEDWDYTRNGEYETKVTWKLGFRLGYMRTRAT
jgi:hypothetical protein